MIDQGEYLRASFQPWSASIGFYALRRDEEGRAQVAGRIEWVERPPFGSASPTFTLDDAAAQRLMDDLWDAGLRPTQGKQSEGMFAAQSAHLADMRAIAFDRLKVDRP